MDDQERNVIRGVAATAASLCDLSDAQSASLAEVLPGLLADAGAIAGSPAADIVTVRSGDRWQRMRVLDANLTFGGNVAAIRCVSLDGSRETWVMPSAIHEQGKLAAILDRQQ